MEVGHVLVEGRLLLRSRFFDQHAVFVEIDLRRSQQIGHDDGQRRIEGEVAERALTRPMVGARVEVTAPRHFGDLCLVDEDFEAGRRREIVSECREIGCQRIA